MLFMISGCATSNDAQIENNVIEEEKYNVTSENQAYKDFSIDNILHGIDCGGIHFNIYIPNSHDKSKSYLLFITFSGYEGLYFQEVEKPLLLR